MKIVLFSKLHAYGSIKLRQVSRSDADDKIVHAFSHTVKIGCNQWSDRMQRSGQYRCIQVITWSAIMHRVAARW